jgi:GH18 family chitinase
MKKIFIFVLLIIVGALSGCVIDDKPVINQLDIETVELLIDALPVTITEAEREQVADVKLMYDALSNDEKALVNNFDILENAEAAIAAIDAAKVEEERLNVVRQDKLKSFQALIEKDIPARVYEDLDLPTRWDTEFGIVWASWSSSDPFTVTSSGIVIPGHIETPITLTALLYYAEAGYNNTLTFDVSFVVDPIQFDQLPIGSLVTVYSYNFAHGYNDKAVETIDIINHAFAYVVEGEVSSGQLGGKTNLLQLRKKGVRVLLTIGGYQDGAIPWSMAAATDAGRKKLAKSIVEDVIKFNYDGVDVDWEYPGYYTSTNLFGWEISTETDRANYTLMMAELRTQLKAADENFILSAAIPGGTNANGFPLFRFDIKALTPILDLFNMMTYDLDSSNRSTHITALHSSSNTHNQQMSVSGTVNGYLSLGGEAIRNKLVIGSGFYGRKFTGTDGIGESASGRGSITYNRIKMDYIDKGYPELWDEVSHAPYIYDATERVFITYDNERSMIEKAQYAKSNGLAGMMVWEYSDDKSGNLINAIYEGMKS